MTHEPVTPGATVPPTRPDPTIRTTAGNSIHPTSRNVERNPATMAMDGPRCDNPDTCPSWADCGGPCRPIEPSGLQSPVGRWVAPRGGYVEDRDDAESDAAFTARLNGQLPRPIGVPPAILHPGAMIPDVAGVPFPAADVGPLVTQAQAEHYRDQLRALNMRPVAAVVACPEVLVVACARAEYERFRAVLVSRSPFGRLIPAWDDELGWARSTFARQARIEAMRERLAVLWPVIVEYLGWA